jgi:NadR type nicotinamide-nucleotide adenylyltransferase
VCDKEGQSIPAALRASWIAELVPDARVIVIPDTLADDDSEGWARYTKEVLGFTPEAVFTSEDYGDAYAHFLGSTHVQVDKQRVAVPVSGTKVRANALAEWEHIDPPVRAHFAKRVAIVGAESTGTTTLARSLAAHYETAWVPEYGRLYSEGKMTSKNEWSSTEFVHVARTQNAMEDMLARSANKILVCDTNAFATTLWHERYLGHMSEAVAKEAEGRHYDLVILTGDEIPFVQDGTRDGEHIRHAMHVRFYEELQKLGIPFLLVRGTPEERLAAATAACDTLIE